FVFIIVLLVFGLIALWGIATIGTVIKYGGFTIEKRPDELFVKRGLLETKELTIPYDRIQAIDVEQNILRMPFKFSRVITITAGSGEGMDEGNPIIFPLLPEKEIEPFLKSFVPGYDGVNQKIIPLHKKGLKYYLVRHVLFFILALIPVMYFFPAYGWIPVVLGALSMLLGWMKFKHTGYRIDKRRIIVSNWGSFTKNRYVFDRRRVQSYQKSQHKFQQMEDLATANFSIISLNTSLRQLSDEDANLIGDWHSRRTNGETAYIHPEARE